MKDRYTISGVSPGISIKEARSLTGDTKLGPPRDTPALELHSSLAVSELSFLVEASTGKVWRVDGPEIEFNGVALVAEGLSFEQTIRLLGQPESLFPPKDIVNDASRQFLGYFSKGSNKVNISVMLDSKIVTGLWLHAFPQESTGWLGISL